ncbi:TetR/AcrR family transcriptional regulator [Paramicrobacterium agarici]|uniref:TetR family transcriptional regulator n=1 Tax=Paramicrobacterium agarici TaxID=630514 RepID=A0A2A9DTV6_9MICO|nr:TetR/AcrR family transcriptional regulator [Microbacterium agarici]PFG29796.1 TetR family transcriptional regulator [Microbacterium agarici]
MSDTKNGRTDYGTGKEALIRAAIRAVATGGLRRLTYRSVAAEAGVAHGLVVHHFGSIQNLLHEALRFAATESLALSSFYPPVDTVDEFAEGLAELAEKDAAVQAFQYELVLESRRDPALVPEIEAYHAQYRAAIHRQLHHFGLRDEALTDLVWATLDGIVFQQTALGRTETSRASLERLRSLLRGLMSERAHS